MQKKGGQAFWQFKFINNLLGKVKFTCYNLQITKEERQMAISNHVQTHFIILNKKFSFEFGCPHRG
jgi:hypothetical protein